MANFLETPEGQQWAADYAAQHNGNLPGQNPGESLDEAIANLMWSRDFAGATGQAPSQQDWEEAWWARQSNDSWFKPYLDLANEALRPDFFDGSTSGGATGGNASAPQGIGSLPVGSGPLAIPPSGSTTVPNPITGQPQDWFGRERYTGEEPPPLAPNASAPAGSGMFSSDYYKQLVGPIPRGVVGDTPAPVPTSAANQTFAPLVGRATTAPQFGPQLPVPRGVQFGPPLPPASPYLSPTQAQQQNSQAFAQTITNPATYTLQGAIPRSADYWGRESARNASALQYMNNAAASAVQGGANNIENFWRYLNQR